MQAQEAAVPQALAECARQAVGAKAQGTAAPRMAPRALAMPRHTPSAAVTSDAGESIAMLRIAYSPSAAGSRV